MGQNENCRNRPDCLKNPKLTSSVSSEPCLLPGEGAEGAVSAVKFLVRPVGLFSPETTAKPVQKFARTRERGRSVCWQVPILLTTDRLTRQQDQLA